MKKNKIDFTIVFLLGGVILLTQCKTNDLIPKKMQEMDPSYVAAYMPTVSGVSNNGGILAFSDINAFNAAYDLLTDSSNSHRIDPNDSSCATDPILDAFENNLNFTSIRKIFENNECTFLENGGDPEYFTDCHIDDDVFAAFMNDEYMVIIGEELFYWPGENLIYSVPLAQTSKMYDFKNNNKSALAAGVEFLTAVMLNEDCSSAYKWKMASSGSNVVNFTWVGTGSPRSSTSKLTWTINGVPNATYDNQNSFSHTFPAQGIYTVCCHLYDDKGTPGKGDDCESGPFCFDVDVSNCSASFSFVEIGTTINFINESTTSIINPTCDWDFGDNTPHSSSFSPSHTYTCNGEKIVKLKITTVDCPAGKTFESKVNVSDADCCNKKYKDNGVVKWDNGKQMIKWKFKLNVVMGLNQHVTAKIVYYNKKHKFRHRKPANLDINFEKTSGGTVWTEAEMGLTDQTAHCECAVIFTVDESPTQSTTATKKLHVKNKLMPIGTDKGSLVRLNRNLPFKVEYIANSFKRCESSWSGATSDPVEGWINGVFNPTVSGGNFDCSEK